MNNAILFIKKHRAAVALYIIWVFIHSIMFVNRSKRVPGRFYYGEGGPSDDFWPFGDSNFHYYTGTEYFVYLFLPPIVFIIWWLFREDIKKKIKS